MYVCAISKIGQHVHVHIIIMSTDYDYQVYNRHSMCILPVHAVYVHV